MRYTEQNIKRFNDKVSVGKLNGCWQWLGAKNRQGYGNIKVQGHVIGSHRFSWMIQNGEIPKNMFVCHVCDNPSCVSIKHLFLGTSSDNLLDMYKKGRGSTKKGEDSNLSALMDSDIVAIRRERQEGKKLKEIAGKYHVTSMAISKIVNHKTWSHI